MKSNKSIQKQQNLFCFSLFDALPDLTLIVNESGGIISANAQSLALVGYTRTEITGLSVELLIPECYREVHAKHFLGYFANPKLRSMGSRLSLYIQHKNGSELPVEIGLSPIETEQGRLVICAIRDISNRKKIETAFLGDERFRLFMKHTPSAVAMFDRQMRYLAVSRRWIEDYQLHNKDILGLSHYDVFPEIAEGRKETHQRVLSGETQEAEGELFLHSNGKKDWVSWKMHPWHLDTGEIGGAILFTEVITERKKIEQAMRESEERFRGIFENAVTGIAIADLAGHFLMCNPAYCNLLGYSNEELCQLEFAALIHPEDRKANVVLYDSLLNGERPFFDVENRYINKSNQPVWVHKFVSILKDANGEPAQLQVLTTDITERKRNEEALCNSDALNVSILNSLTSHIAVLDGQGLIVAVNNAWRRFARENGVAENEETMLGVNYLEVCEKAINQTSGEEANTAYSGITKVLAGSLKAFYLEYPCHSPDQQRWFYMKVTPLLGSSRGVVVIHENITERKQAEAKLNSIFNAAVEGIISYDLAGIIISSNASVESIFGYKPAELIGSSIHKLQLSKGVPLFTNKTASQIQEVEGIHKNGSKVPLDVSRAEYKIDSKRFFTIIVRDISLRKKREELDKMHLNELAHVTRLGLMGEMASGIAHEINQPLSAISSYTQASINLIRSEKADLKVISEIAYKTQQQALRAGQIIHRMREFIKSGSKHRSSVEINALINDAVSMCADEVKQNRIELSFDLENDLPTVFADHIQIEQVLINLIRNGIDVLQCLPEKQKRHLSIHSQLTELDEIEIRVKDNGPGMDYDQQQKILTPFYTTKQYGMGMGLSICRSLIESHRGILRFNSKLGKGTSFYFTLPLQKFDS